MQEVFFFRPLPIFYFFPLLSLSLHPNAEPFHRLEIPTQSLSQCMFANHDLVLLEVTTLAYINCYKSVCLTMGREDWNELKRDDVVKFDCVKKKKRKPLKSHSCFFFYVLESEFALLSSFMGGCTIVWRSFNEKWWKKKLVIESL